MNDQPTFNLSDLAGATILQVLLHEEGDRQYPIFRVEHQGKRMMLLADVVDGNTVFRVGEDMLAEEAEREPEPEGGE